MVWPEDADDVVLPRRYRAVRWLTRQLSDVWFREFSVIGHDQIPDKGGVLHIAWHAGAMIDPMLMFSGMPGKMTFVAKHTLWNVPILRSILNAAGARPVRRAQDGGGKSANAALIETMAEILAEGEHCAIFPEGRAHLLPHLAEVKTGPARILLRAIELADEQGLPRPTLQPVGLHYSDQHRFRERALMEVYRPIQLPPIPGEEGAPEPSEEELTQFAEAAAGRAWVRAVTDLIEVELNRSIMGMESWEERHLVWRARGLVHQARLAQSGEPSSRQPYAEAIASARRVRAAYQWLQEHDAERAWELRDRVESHHVTMEAYDLSEYEIFTAQHEPSRGALNKAWVKVLWCWFWMLGLVGWTTMIGNYPPYRAAGIIANRLAVTDKTGKGSYKLLLALVLMPLWWLGIAMPVAWLLDATVSSLDLPAVGPLTAALIALVESVPWPLMGVILMFAFPLAARQHIRLYMRTCRAWAVVKRWHKLRDESVPWRAIRDEQVALAHLMAEIGLTFVLPGDADWVDPPAGKDDWEVVRRRAEQSG